MILRSSLAGGYRVGTPSHLASTTIGLVSRDNHVRQPSTQCRYVQLYSWLVLLMPHILCSLWAIRLHEGANLCLQLIDQWASSIEESWTYHVLGIVILFSTRCSLVETGWPPIGCCQQSWHRSIEEPRGNRIESRQESWTFLDHFLDHFLHYSSRHAESPLPNHIMRSQYVIAQIDRPFLSWYKLLFQWQATYTVGAGWFGPSTLFQAALPKVYDTILYPLGEASGLEMINLGAFIMISCNQFINQNQHFRKLVGCDDERIDGWWYWR